MTAAPALRRRPVPVSEPRAARRVIEPIPAAQPQEQCTLALLLDGRAEPSLPRPDDVQGFDRLRTSSTALPDAAGWAAQFVQAAIEVGNGVRSPAQLVRWTTAPVHALLVRRWSLATRVSRSGSLVRRSAVVRNVRVCRPRDGVCEASAVVLDQGRVRAVAVRMEGLDGRWQVTAFEAG